MGLNLIFDKDNADLTGIAKITKLQDRIYVSDIIQSSLFEVNEKGTKDAVASSTGSITQNIY